MDASLQASVATITRQFSRRFLRTELTVARLLVDAAIYVFSFAFAVACSSVVLRIACGVLCGFAIARLFLIGHDACHGSYFRSKRWNRVAGALTFLPSYTPFQAWEYAHNFVHHGFTNLKGKDYVWAPLSRIEYHSLPRWRQCLERLYRHPLGYGPYYFFEIWMKKLLIDGYRRARGRRGRLDFALLGAFLILQILLIGAAQTHDKSISAGLLFGLIVPAIVWNALMGIVTHLHHTHPRIRWFNTTEGRRGVWTQLYSASHVTLPWPMRLWVGSIMDHTAHHIHATLPSCGLPEVQQTLETRLKSHIVTERWSWRVFLENSRICKLYDFERHCWLDFEGVVTAQISDQNLRRQTES